VVVVGAAVVVVTAVLGTVDGAAMAVSADAGPLDAAVTPSAVNVRETARRPRLKRTCPITLAEGTDRGGT
jgi:hypothetical protein